MCDVVKRVYEKIYMKKILIIDDEVSVCSLLTRFLSKHGFETESSTSGAQALRLVKEQKFDMILCDYHLQDINGKDLFEKIQPILPNAIVIFITGYADVRVAVDLIKHGAYHYLSKPLYPDEILELINKAFAEGARPEKVSATTTTEKPKTGRITQHIPEGYVTGNSAASEKLFNHVELVAPTDYSVIIYGETGTGKESLAQLIHQGSKRKDGPFIPIDCGSLSKELAASELFGHEKGAFTGALTAKAGAFELAEGGTIFLDEIGNLSYDVQVYLLRALQEKVVRRVGSIKTQSVDVRIIVASNENLYELVNRRVFREDLYHRLNEFTLIVPSLRDRKDDLELFVASFVQKAEQELDKKIAGISEQVWDKIYAYHWPGNVRELKNVIRRACLITGANKEITVKALPLELLDPIPFSSTGNMRGSSLPQQGQVEEHPAKEETEISLKGAASQAEQKRIMEVLRQVQFNKTKAAALLNIDRKTLYNKLRSMQIQ